MSKRVKEAAKMPVFKGGPTLAAVLGAVLKAKPRKSKKKTVKKK